MPLKLSSLTGRLFHFWWRRPFFAGRSKNAAKIWGVIGIIFIMCAVTVIAQLPLDAAMLVTGALLAFLVLYKMLCTWVQCGLRIAELEEERRQLELEERVVGPASGSFEARLRAMEQISRMEKESRRSLPARLHQLVSSYDGVLFVDFHRVGSHGGKLTVRVKGRYLTCEAEVCRRDLDRDCVDAQLFSDLKWKLREKLAGSHGEVVKAWKEDAEERVRRARDVHRHSRVFRDSDELY